jgi:phosphoglycerate dehydrogenase-like enzyme
MNRRPVIVVENDPFPRLLRAFLARDDDPGQTAAIAEFVAHDVADYHAWLRSARARAGSLHPADVRLASTREELHAALPDADAVVVESLPVGEEQLALAPRLRVVQKYGTVLRNVDTRACARRSVAVLTLRRRANIACAEHAWALLLALTRKLTAIDGLVSMEALREAGYAPGMFDTRYTPNSNWARIGGLRTLYGATAGIIGLGEIGREVALRAAAFGMTITYHQRTALSADEIRSLQMRYCALEDLLVGSDVVFVALPLNSSTRGLLGAPELAKMKPGAVLINVSRAAIVDREAVLAALKSCHLGGLGLDAFYDEPGRPGDPLLACANAVITPRVAAQPRANALSDLSDVMANLSQALAGR